MRLGLETGGRWGGRKLAALLLGVAGISAASGCAGSTTEAVKYTGVGVEASLEMRAAAAGVAIVDKESEMTHTHTKLSIVVNGEAVEVPADIGIDRTKQQLTVLHTHRTDGILHVESPNSNDTYTLAQFFHLWGIGGGEVDLCQHFLQQPYCAITITSADQGVVELGEVLRDGDSLSVDIIDMA